MTDERTTGLVLRTRRLTESSLIVHWLTPEAGRLATVAKGALRPKSPFRGKLDLFHLAQLSYARSRRSQLHTLREVVLQETHPALRKDLALLQAATGCIRFVESVTETDTPLPDYFLLTVDLLGALPQAASPLWVVLAFELKVLSLLGQGAPPGPATLPPDTTRLLELAGHAGLDLLGRIRPSSFQLTELERFVSASLHAVGLPAFHLPNR